MTPYYPPEGGGLERYAHAIARRLSERDHEVRALCFTASDRGDEVREGVPVERLTPSLRLGNAPVHPRFPRQVRARIREHDADVVWAHTPVPFPAESAFLATRREDVPFTLTYHAGRLRGSSRALSLLAGLHRHTLERVMLSRSEAAIAVSPFVREEVFGNRDDVELVAPGVDAKRFSPDGPPQGQEILFVGPLSSSYEWKGLDTLWEAFRVVREQREDARLHLVGAGDRIDEFRAYARRLDGHLAVSGRVSDEELVEAYRRARVVVLPSTSEAESFGMVLAEANACGRPVVGSAIGGIPGFVREGDNGLLARPGEADDLADKILAVLEDDDRARRMGERGRERVLVEHDWDELAARTERVLARAASL